MNLQFKRNVGVKVPLCSYYSLIHSDTKRVCKLLALDKNTWDHITVFKLLILFRVFFTPVLADGFSLAFERQQVSLISRILLNILADLDKTIVWMVPTRLLISKSSSPFINPLVTVLRASLTIGIPVTFIFHSFGLVEGCSPMGGVTGVQY